MTHNRSHRQFFLDLFSFLKSKQSVIEIKNLVFDKVSRVILFIQNVVSQLNALIVVVEVAIQENKEVSFQSSL